MEQVTTSGSMEIDFSSVVEEPAEAEIQERLRGMAIREIQGDRLRVVLCEAHKAAYKRGYKLTAIHLSGEFSKQLGQYTMFDTELSGMHIHHCSPTAEGLVGLAIFAEREKDESSKG